MSKTRGAASVWKSGNGITLHGSVFYGCAHSQVLALQGHEVDGPPPFMQKLFDAGHESERKRKDWFRARGLRVKDRPEGVDPHATGFDAQIELKRFYDGPEGKKILLSLHPDGVVAGTQGLPGEHWIGEQWSGEPALWEHKALSPEKFAAFLERGVSGVSRRYEGQVSAAIVLARETAAANGKPRPNMGLVFSAELREYDSATKTYRLTGKCAYQFLREPIFSAQLIEERCQSIARNWLNGVVPECDSEYPCDYPGGKGGAAERRTPEDYSGPDETSLGADLAAYAGAQCEVSYYQERMAALRPSIEERLGPGLWRVRGFLADVRCDRRGRRYFSVSKVSD